MYLYRNTDWIRLTIFIVAVGLATWLSWRPLTHYGIYKSDLRQAPQWAAFHQDTFHPDDLLVKYGTYNESPVQNTIYWLGTWFCDMITLSKILAVLSFGFIAALLYNIGQNWFDRTSGVLMALFFIFLPDQFDWSAGFFSRVWLLPGIIITMYLLDNQRYNFLVLLFPFAALTYPPAVPVCAIIAGIYLVLITLDDLASVRQLFFYLAGGSALALIILLLKYSHFPAFIGSMRPGSELLEMVEFYSGGMNRTPYLPTTPVIQEITSKLITPFSIVAGGFYFLVLGRRVAWERSWTALLLASILGYFLADQLFLRLYFPNRFSRQTMALLLILWNARNLRLILQENRPRWVTQGIFCLVLMVGLWFYRGEYSQYRNAYDRRSVEQLCHFIRDVLPPEIMLAGKPKVMDDIPIQAQRSVLCNYKMAHPWFTTYYDEIKERTKATYRAIYADNLAQVDYLYHQYGVSHLVLDQNSYHPKTLSKSIYVKPYSDYIKELIEGKERFLLQDPPEKNVVYRDGRFTILRLPVVEVSGI